MSESSSQAYKILDRLRVHISDEDAKAKVLLQALEDALRDEDERQAAAQKLLEEYEEAYQKLTAPANRLAMFLNWMEDHTALIALGDTEYVAQVDPKIPESDLETGSRIKINEAYAVIGSAPESRGGALMKVAEILEDGRLRLGGDMPDAEGRYVLRAQALADEAIQVADVVRLDATGRVAIEWLPKNENRDFFFEDVPEVPWDKIGGQDEAIALIKQTIEHPLLHPEIYEKFDKKPIKGILLYGPPGCGKTLIGKATAYNLTKEYSARAGREVKEYFMYISGPKILNMWLGESERMVREIFRTAREKAKEGRLVFIFMDEAESILRTRSSGRWLNISNTVVPQFCAELDGLVSLENVVLMLTSNRPDYIDPAVLRAERIDRKVKIRRPDRAASAEILGIYLHERLPFDPGLMTKHKCEAACARQELIDQTIDFLWKTAKESEFLRIAYRNGSGEILYWKDLVSGALLKSVVDRAKDLAIQRAVADPDGEHGISLDDLTSSVAAEFAENEIFPKTDTQDDWLKLLDVEPENVASVRPISARKVDDRRQRVI